MNWIHSKTTDASGRKPQCVYITDDCQIKETDTDIIITEPGGKEHKFAKGSYVFTKREGISSWDIKK